jgi:signal transduction histidine kinase
MKILPKLTLALFAGTCTVLAVNGYFRVKREVGIFEVEREREHEVMGRALAVATMAIWRAEGSEPALATIDAAKKRFAPKVGIRWVDADRLPPLPMAPEPITQAPLGEPVTRIVPGADGLSTWYTFVPIGSDGVRRGYLELTESATRERSFARAVLVDTIKTALAFALVSAVLSYLMGQWVLGGPIRRLVEKARRIGRGDFSGPIVLGQKDELADLAREVNAMCERLVAMIEQLRHADRLATVGKLAAGIAHELGTPLNVVSARASMIASAEAADPTSRDYARVIGEASMRMTKIIRQLMQFARRKTLTKAETDVLQLARDTVDLLRPLAKKRDVELVVEATPGSTTAFVDGAQAQQVMTNLVVNAIQAIPGGGRATVRVGRSTARTPVEAGERELDCVRLVVQDDGEGIAKEDLPRIFEPFFTTKDVGEGTGLGLAVVYGIVRDHGGWIDVKSERGHGATFTVFFPREVAS